MDILEMQEKVLDLKKRMSEIISPVPEALKITKLAEIIRNIYTRLNIFDESSFL